MGVDSRKGVGDQTALSKCLWRESPYWCRPKVSSSSTTYTPLLCFPTGLYAVYCVIYHDYVISGTARKVTSGLSRDQRSKDTKENSVFMDTQGYYVRRDLSLRKICKSKGKGCKYHLNIYGFALAGVVWFVRMYQAIAHAHNPHNRC